MIGDVILYFLSSSNTVLILLDSALLIADCIFIESFSPLKFSTYKLVLLVHSLFCCIDKKQK